METNQETVAAARAAVDEYVRQALLELGAMGEVRKRLSESRSPKAQMDAEVIRRNIQSARSRLVGARSVLADIEELVRSAEGWDERFERVQRM